MAHYQTSFHVDAPVDQVWDLVCDSARLTEWNVEFDEARDAAPKLDTVGAGVTQVKRIAGIEMKGRWEITSVEPHVRREFAGSAPGVVFCHGIETYKSSDGGTTVTVEFEYRPRWGIVGSTLDRIFGHRHLARTMARNAENLRKALG